MTRRQKAAVILVALVMLLALLACGLASTGGCYSQFEGCEATAEVLDAARKAAIGW